MQMGDYLIGFKRIKSAFFLNIFYEWCNIAKVYVLQFSFKDMWLKPQCRSVDGFELYGWLFIYFGYYMEEINFNE